jgi:hypothetical protein
MIPINDAATYRFTPVLKNNNNPKEWAKFAYAIFQCGFYMPECSFYNHEDTLKKPEPGYVFPSNFFMFSFKDGNEPKDYQTFIDTFKEYQPNGCTLVFSLTTDDKNRISVLFPPDKMYDAFPANLKSYMPMISCFCSKNDAEKAHVKIMRVYDKL